MKKGDRVKMTELCVKRLRGIECRADESYRGTVVTDESIYGVVGVRWDHKRRLEYESYATSLLEVLPH